MEEETWGKRTVGGYILGQVENEVLVGSLWGSIQRAGENEQLELGRDMETNNKN